MEKNDKNPISFDEKRRQKAENFHLNIVEDADAGNAVPEEINSYSGQDVRKQIERESLKSEKKRIRQQKREKKKRNRHNRRMFRLMWIASVVLVGTMIATYLVTGMNDLLAINRADDTEVSVKIPAEPTLDQVTDILLKNGVIKEGSYFKMFATVTKSDHDFAEGTYQLRKNMDYQAILTNLEGTASRTDTVEVTIIEGMSVVEIADTLVSGGALSEKDKQTFLDYCASDKFDNDFDFLKEWHQFHQCIILHIRFLLYLHIIALYVCVYFGDVTINALHLLFQCFQFALFLFVLLDDIGTALRQRALQRIALDSQIGEFLDLLVQTLALIIQLYKIVNGIQFL